MARITRRLPLKLLILGATLTLLTIAADNVDLLEQPENVLYNVRALRCQYFAPPPSPDIVHLDIDDASIDAIGAWPWPRSVFADIMDEVRLASPKVVLLDILFIDPARPEWEPVTSGNGKTHFVKIDDDAILAASFRQMGNAILPVHLNIGEPPPISPLELEVRDVFRKDLECDQEQMAKTVPASGVSDEVWLTAFLSARRFVVVERISQAWDELNPDNDLTGAADLAEMPAPVGSASESPPLVTGAGPMPPNQSEGTTQPEQAPSTQPAEAIQPAPAPSTQPEATTQPAPAPSTQPEPVSDISMTLPLSGPLERRIILQLLPHTDLTISSPLLREVDDAFRQVRARRVLRRFTFPLPRGLPILYRPTDTAFPIPQLSSAAAGTAFVDYASSQDGKTRAVPLMLEYEGRMYPQMGLMLASMMLGVSPREFRCTPDSITIPMAGRANGKGGVWRRDIVIPIQTYHSSVDRQPIPTYFNIPYFGGRAWESMYDPAHPRDQKQHLSINAVHDACVTRQRIEGANLKIDRFLQNILNTFDEGTVRSFLEHPPSPKQPLSRRGIVEYTYNVLRGLGISVDKPPEEKDIADENERVLFRNIKALRAADQESVLLSEQLNHERQFLRTQMQNKGVLIGAVATGLDLKSTPIHYSAPGVIIHGTIVNAILTGRMWRQAPEWVTTLVTLAAGLMTTAIVAWMSPPLALVSSGALAIGYLLLNGLVIFDYGNVILGAAGPLIAIAAVWSQCTLVRLLAERFERARITLRFGTYVDPRLVNEVIKHPERTKFEGETREMSMVFSDLAGFTTFTEQMGEKAIGVLNDYMREMIPTIRAQKGFVACLMGDGIFCFFGAPEPDPDHAFNAVQSVCAMRGKLDMLNESFRKRGLPSLGMRVGVTTGNVIVGDAGCPPVRSDYTALGDPVNLAARLESANKFFGTNCLITNRTAELLNGSFLVRPVANVRVKGKGEAVVVLEPLCPVADATPETRRIVECTEQVVSAYQRAEFEACIAAADRLEQETAQSKKLAGLYRELARQNIANPPDAFDGGVTLTEK